MPIWPNPEVTVPTIQSAVDAWLNINTGELLSDELFSFPVPAYNASNSHYEPANQSLIFNLIQPDNGLVGNQFAWPWLLNWTNFSAPLDTNLPFGVQVSLNDFGNVNFGFIDPSTTIKDQIPPCGIQFQATGWDASAGQWSGGNITVSNQTGSGSITLQALNADGTQSSSLLVDSNGNITLTMPDFNCEGVLSFSIGVADSNPGYTWWHITNSAGASIFSMSATGVIHTQGIDSLNGSYSATGSYDVRYLNGSSITENWMTGTASAVTTVTIDWAKSYSASAPPFIQITLSGAGTVSGYTATTTSITVTFSAAYTGNVNVYAMGAS